MTETHIAHDPVIEDVLAAWRSAIGDDAAAYRGHVYRVFNFCHALHGQPAARDAIAVAAVFHDLGIWSDGTFDYLAPSIARAQAHLAERQAIACQENVPAMIALHHKLTPCGAAAGALAEAFRRADLIDLSLGTITFGLPRECVSAVRAAFPNAGFHRCLLRLGTAWFVRHPLRPLPMMRW